MPFFTVVLRRELYKTVHIDGKRNGATFIVFIVNLKVTIIKELISKVRSLIQTTWFSTNWTSLSIKQEVVNMTWKLNTNYSLRNESGL